MHPILKILPAFAIAALLPAQTAEELVAKNILAKGGIEKIKSIRSLRMSGKIQQGSFTIRLMVDSVAPERLRQSITIQGMTQVVAYDGATGWQISPFQGRRDPELLGEDDLRGLIEDADFYGPLVDYEKKGNTIAYLGHETVDGDDAYHLKVTLKNGDIVYYFLDPETYLEIKTVTVRHIRGAVRETFNEYGSYKQVAGVYYPFSVEGGSSGSSGRSKITFEKIEANVTIAESEFKWPANSPAKPK